MAHLVYIKAKNDTKFNYASFAAYKNKEGKTVQLIDPDGQPVDKWELYQSMHAFDLEECGNIYKVIQWYIEGTLN